MLGFTALERAILDAYEGIYGANEPRLARQIAAARPASRENTGAGFHTYLTVDRTACEKIVAGGPLGDHYMHIEGMEHGVGILLFFSEGYLNEIDGYSTAGEDTSAIDFTTTAFGPLTELIVPTAEAERPAASGR
ncbi:hypothetical protein [uncultured Caulobacter sp.]|uniref:hypothetical protein n=1 Tax=uncultured Caulobacter sp. TaxID=158749 RepID=UPI0026346D1B|nr:hypothetical protein [uncultured Caulobacter sp.]